jgi:hypothetical protein
MILLKHINLLKALERVNQSKKWTPNSKKINKKYGFGHPNQFEFLPRDVKSY